MPPRILVLWASESSPNLGVAALARGSRDLLLRIWPDAEIVSINYGARPPELPWGRPRSLIRERVAPRFGMQEYFAGFDLVWDTRSGDSFADIYGLDRHLTMSLVFEFATQTGTPAILAPQTIGPFSTHRGRMLARRSLARAMLVASRDPESTEAAHALGRRPDETTADLVFAIEQPNLGEPRDVLFNVSGLLWAENPHVDAQSYRGVVRETVSRLRAEGRTVTLLSHVLRSANADDDVPAAEELAASLAGDVEILVPTDLDDVRSAIAASDLVIGSRMHACLNALSVGVPTIPLAYSRKFAPLLNSVGWNSVFDLRTTDPTELPAQVLSSAARVTAADARAAAARGRASLSSLASMVSQQEL